MDQHDTQPKDVGADAFGVRERRKTDMAPERCKCGLLPASNCRTRADLPSQGDLKPLELPISHFFDLAYDIDLWDKDSTPQWLELWAAREFGQAVAVETAALMNNYSLAAGRRKFELVDPTVYSLIDYSEADNILAEWKALQATAQGIMDSLPVSTQPAFFEMVYHAVSAGCTFHDLMISAAKNNLYAEQGRTSTNAMAQHVLNEFAYDHQLTAQYNGLLDGKWDHMMDQTHLGYVYWYILPPSFVPVPSNIDTDLLGSGSSL